MAWPTSDRWDAACRTSRAATVTAAVWSQGSPTGTELEVAGGSLRVDDTSKARRAGTIIVRDTDLMPTSADDLLSPTTADIFVSVGHRYADGQVETVPVGMLRVLVPRLPSLDGPLTLEVGDGFAVLGSTRWPVPRVTTAGKRVVTEIGDMVRSVLPWVEVIDLTGSQAVCVSQTWTGTVGDAVLELATASGAEAFFDPIGRLILRSVPDGSSGSVWTLDTDTPTAAVEDAAQSVDLSRIFNAVYVESSDPSLASPVSAVVYQSSGPLRWQPGFQRVRRFASPLLKTAEQCAAAGRTILARSPLFSTTVEPTGLPNWALDAGDTVTLAIAGAPTGTRVLTGLGIGLGATDMRMPMSVRGGMDAVSVAAGFSEMS